MKNKGQIKLSFIPKENLKRLRDQVTRRKKSNTDSKSFSSRFSSASCTSLNVMAPINNSRCSVMSGSNTKLDEIDIKSGLAKNLNELDQFNKIFNERLNRNNFDINADLVKLVKEKAEKCIKKTQDILKDNQSSEKAEYLAADIGKAHDEDSSDTQSVVIVDSKSQFKPEENIKNVSKEIQVSFTK